MLEKIYNAWEATSHLEIVSVIFGLAYIVLAARENSWCWPCAFIGTSTAVMLFWEGLLPMESALNAYYLIMAVYGWWQWQSRQPNTENKRKITSWQLKQHLLSIGLISFLTLVSGYFLTQNTNAALPYLDSFTTWAAVVTTWMVTQKILENWLYWLLINSASIYLFLEREFYLYALLFALYIVISVYGYVTWKQIAQHDARA